MMKTETLSNGLSLPKIGFGTWNIGGGTTPDYSKDDVSIRAIRAALDVGYTHFDTAEMYADGHTEVLLARALKEAGVQRESVFITTKVTPANLHHDDLLRACEGSLRRLETDYIDLYLIHWPGDAPLEESFRALNRLQRDGLIRHIGVSNFKLDRLKRSVELCDTPIVTNQVPYSLTNRSYARNGVLDYCQENDMLLTAYTPVKKGGLRTQSGMKDVAEKHNATPHQIALAWLIRQPRVITIPMSINPDHIAENFAAGEIVLDEDDMARLD